MLLAPSRCVPAGRRNHRLLHYILCRRFRFVPDIVSAGASPPCPPGIAVHPLRRLGGIDTPIVGGPTVQVIPVARTVHLDYRREMGGHHAEPPLAIRSRLAPLARDGAAPGPVGPGRQPGQSRPGPATRESLADSADPRLRPHRPAAAFHPLASVTVGDRCAQLPPRLCVALYRLPIGHPRAWWSVSAAGFAAQPARHADSAVGGHDPGAGTGVRRPRPAGGPAGVALLPLCRAPALPGLHLLRRHGGGVSARRSEPLRTRASGAHPAVTRPRADL